MLHLGTNLAKIQHERQRLEDELTRIRPDMVAKETRLAELMIAERVLTTLVPDPPHKSKPDNIPTISTMVKSCLLYTSRCV